MAIFQAEHEALIEDRLELTGEIRNIQLEAKADSNAELEAEAEAAAEEYQSENISVFVIDLDADVNGKADAKADFGSKNRVDSEAEAKAIVKKKIGLEATDVKMVVKGNITYYVVSDAETELSGLFTLTKQFEVWIDSETSIITSIDMDTHIASESEAQAESESGDSTSSSASAKSKGRLGVNVG